MVTTIRGKFHEWQGQVEAEDDQGGSAASGA
jgi:hypothetical protein